MTTAKTLKVVFTADYDWLCIAEREGLEIDWESEPEADSSEAAQLALDSEWECDFDPEDSELGLAVLVEPRYCDTALRAGDILLTSGPGGDVAFLRQTLPE
jgi:hypothetical protein